MTAPTAQATVPSSNLASNTDAGSSAELDQVEQETYDPIQYDSDEDATRAMPDENLEVAAHIMAELFEAHDVEYAVVGGFSLKLRGSTRRTVDVDFGVNLTGKSLWDVMTQAPQRLIIPNTKKIAGVVRIFVKTGPTYGDKLESDELVSVDLLLPGFGGWPSSKDIKSAREQIEAVVLGRKVNIWVQTIQYTMRAKLGALETRQAAKDFYDIMFLLNNYSDEVSGIADALNEDHKREFIDSEFLASASDEYRLQLSKLLKLHSTE